ncbi:MAG: cell separation during budding [Pycnora praestabilis]|nr:MAG: cell separation during budding [Pycnora praestabilis]
MADKNPLSERIVSPTRSAANVSSSSSDAARSPTPSNVAMRLGPLPSPNPSHRQSFNENLRGLPPSPRSQRQPSFSQAAVQDLLNNPPAAQAGDPAFTGRDWRAIQVGELVSDEEIWFVDLDTGVEHATNLLIDSGGPAILIREIPSSKSAIGTFDYSDLNAYLLLVVGLAHPDESHMSPFQELAKKARQGNKIPLKDVKEVGKKEPFVTLSDSEDLTKAVETFGSGVHRIIIVKQGTNRVVGILSQSRLVRFLWENGRSFPVIDGLYPQYLKDLNIGSHTVIAINGDKPLTDALELMNNEGVTSLAVVDNQLNVIGNISNVDVKLLTKTSSLPLLQSSCIHFISVILSNRGMNDGKDSFPVFHVNPFSTLAHTVAKLVATKAHRMWVVDAPSPASSGPPTPAAQPAVLVPPPGLSSSSSAPGNPSLSLAPSPSVSASSLPGARMSGRLSGVVSLTDILNLYARASGLHPNDPDETRKQRRRSSSSSMRVSLDSARSSSVDLSRR